MVLRQGMILSWRSPLLLLGLAVGGLTPVVELPGVAQVVAQTVDQRKAEEDRVLQQCRQALQKSQYEAAVKACDQAVATFRQLKQLGGEVKALNNLGVAYYSLKNYEKAIASHEQSLALARALKDRQGEGRSLSNLGDAYNVLGNYAKVLEYYEQNLVIARELKDRKNERRSLSNLGDAYNSLGNFSKAIEYHEQSLAIARELKDRQAELGAMANLSIAYLSTNNFVKAIKYLEPLLAVARERKNRSLEGVFLTMLGVAHIGLSDHPKVIKYLEQSLAISQEVKTRQDEIAISKTRQDEMVALAGLGMAYHMLNNYSKGLEYHQQLLTLARKLRDRKSEGIALSGIGIAYSDMLGNYAKAIEYQEQSLAIARELKNRQEEGRALGLLGDIYRSLDNHSKAIEYQEQSLAIARELKNRQEEGRALNRLGTAYRSLGNYAKAIEYHQQGLAIAQELKSRWNEGDALGKLGDDYYYLGNYTKAIEYYEQSLVISREVKNRRGEGVSLSDLGNAYRYLGNYARAMEYYEQSLAIDREIKNREGEGIILGNIGLTLRKQQQIELAIIFYKQSVNVRETIRKDIRTLSRDLQESYTQTVAGTYRALADLLLAQGRIGEAQQVLELLKVQELRDYTRDTRAGDTPSMALDKSETEIIKAHTTLVAFAQEIQTCSDDPACANSKRLEVLIQQRNQQNAAFTKLVKTLEAQLKQRGETDVAFINPNDPNNDFRRRAEEIITSQPGTLLIYPLVLEDKMWLLVGSSGPVFTRYEVKVSQKELAATILEFRAEMKRCETSVCTPADTARVKQISQKIYQWMFPAKLQKELQANVKQPIQNLVFAPDRATRYIPMGALFDGKQYLIERYTISTIVAASKTDSGAKLPSQPTVLAMGLSDAVSGFSALPGVPGELDAIVKTTSSTDSRGIFPGDEVLNQIFTKSKLQIGLPRYQILHLATHGKFVPGAIEQSFLVLGDGNPFTIPDIQGLDGLPGVHLVVLSACETALGDRREQDGIEIAGISNAFLQRGAKSVIASLWQVNDPSTSLWMQRFYQNLARGNLTKSQAIQQVQLDFLKGKVTLKELQSFRASADRHLEAGRQIDLTHPYYWAPFILIGNAL